MNAKHTPGPWSVPQPLVEGSGITFSPVFATTLIAKVYSTAFGDHQQAIANAVLMAAAPELLEALESLLEAANAAKSATTAGAEQVALAGLFSPTHKARAAIAKAKGEQC